MTARPEALPVRQASTSVLCSLLQRSPRSHSSSGSRAQSRPARPPLPAPFPRSIAKAARAERAARQSFFPPSSERVQPIGAGSSSGPPNGCSGPPKVPPTGPSPQDWPRLRRALRSEAGRTRRAVRFGLRQSFCTSYTGRYVRLRAQSFRHGFLKSFPRPVRGRTAALRGSPCDSRETAVTGWGSSARHEAGVKAPHCNRMAFFFAASLGLLLANLLLQAVQVTSNCWGAVLFYSKWQSAPDLLQLVRLCVTGLCHPPEINPVFAIQKVLCLDRWGKGCDFLLFLGAASGGLFGFLRFCLEQP